MQISISGRNLTVTDGMKEHLENKLNSVIDSRVLKVTSVKAVLSHERNRNKAEIVVYMKSHVLEADSETYEMYEAMDSAVEKIDAQIRRQLDKAQDHHKTPLYESEIKVEEASELEVIEE